MTKVPSTYLNQHTGLCVACFIAFFSKSSKKKSLPVEMAEEARQETVRIIETSSRPRNNITRAERKAPKTLKNYTDLTILPADKSNATVILNTADYKQKITSLLEGPAYRRLTRDPTDSTE
jgi:uncharacterized phosphosugar-binding protein